MNRATIIGICAFNIAAVGYMGYLVSKIYNRPKPQTPVQVQQTQTDQPDLALLMTEFFEAEEAEDVAVALRRLPATLEPPASEQVAELLLDPGELEQAFPAIRPSQRIGLRDGLSSRISSPPSLNPNLIERLEAGAIEDGPDPILRQQFASTLFDAALRLVPEAELETPEPNREALLESTLRLVEQNGLLSGSLEPLRLRAWRLLANRHPDRFDQTKLLELARQHLRDPAAPEAILMEAIVVVGEGRDRTGNAALLGLLKADVSRQVKEDALRALALTGGIEEARTLILMPSPTDLQLTRALHETAEKILARQTQDP